MENNKMHFKIFLSKESDQEDSKPEIRRFSLDRNISRINSFTYLCEKLESISEDLKNKPFKITWKDEDNDDIVISSNEEFNEQIAVCELLNLQVLKLYVVLHDNEGESLCDMDLDLLIDSKIEGLRDWVCDACDKKNNGFRYRCLKCDDFDLCTDCEKKGFHAEHHMIRLPNKKKSKKPKRNYNRSNRMQVRCGSSIGYNKRINNKIG